MKKYLSNIGMAAALILLMTACGTKTTQDIVSKALSLDISSGRQVSNYDTHSGNGDGTSCMIVSFNYNTVLTKIQESTEWKELPLDETVQALVYGIEEGTVKNGLYLTDEDGNPLVPEIQNGYYLLIDRQVEKDKAMEADILHRGSFNFDLGVYDADTNTLYFCQLDT